MSDFRISQMMNVQNEALELFTPFYILNAN